MKIDPNEGCWERELRIAKASWLAFWRCQFHWSESELFYDDEKGRVTFVGTCTGPDEITNTVQVVKKYYGEPPPNTTQEIR